MNSFARAFVASRSAVIGLTATYDEAMWNLPSPLTPEWRVRDVLGHLCGVSEDVIAGNFPTSDMGAWTSAQVERHRHDSIDSVVERWSSSGIEDRFDEHFAQMLFDQISHEFDIRYALGASGDTSSDGVRLATKFAVRMLRGERAVTVTMDDDVITFEGSAPPLTLECTHFDLLRLSTGRRSWSQVASLSWDGDLDYVRGQLFGSGFFTPAPFTVVET